MKSITIRDLRHRWPQAESWLQEEGELLVTRDSKPVAKLTKVLPQETRKRFSAKKQATWRKAVFGDAPPQSWVGEALDQSRADRDLL
ncbi:hypothetical protein BH11VER1_BH11VER1_41170 [soil metagenome]